MKADWNAIRAEYIGGGISQRKLAAKYGVTYPALRSRAEAEGWVNDREKAKRRVVAQATQKLADLASDNATRAERIKQKLLIRLENEIDALPENIGSQTQQAIIDNAYDSNGKRLKQIKEARKEYNLRDLTTSFVNLTKDMDFNKNNEQVRIIIDV